MFFDLGVKMVGELSERAIHRSHALQADCAKHAETVGSSHNGDAYLRHSALKNGELVQRFEPELGCEALEVKRIGADGTVYNDAEILSSHSGTDESLFEDDHPEVKAVSRTDFLAAYEAKYGRPFFANSADRMEQAARDLSSPLLTPSQ